MACGFLFAVAVSLTLGRGRIFWEDEMLGWMVLTDPSWHHMVQAWKLGADGGGFAFYLTCRGWLHLFGPSETAFRLYSATCFGLAFVLNWLTMRRFYGSPSTGFALFATYFLSPPILLHLAEGRFYGLLMLAVSAAVWLTVKLQEVQNGTPSGAYLLAFAAHALLTTSHLLGVVYSFFILCSMVLLDRLNGRFRPLLYASVAASWLLLLAELPAIRASAAVGKPWFWTTRPGISRFVGVYIGFSPELGALLGALAILAAIAVWRRPVGWRFALAQACRVRRTAFVVALSLLLVPLAFLIEGFAGPSLFIDRYTIPVSLATAFVLAEAMQLIDWWPAAKARWLGALALAATVGWLVLVHLPNYQMPQFDYTGRLASTLPKNVPVLLEDAWSFTEIIGRQHDSGVQFLYPLDWAQSTSPQAPRLEVTQYNLMKNWRTAGYFSGSIVDLPAFLERTPRFLVVANDPLDAVQPRFLGNPLVLRFSKTPGYTVERYVTLKDRGKQVSAWMITHDPRTTGLPVECGALDSQCPAEPAR